MKILEYSLDKFQFRIISSSFRTKIDVIRFWMNAIKLMSAYSAPSTVDVQAKLQVKIDKMSRIFVSSEEKCFSVNFPFSVREDSEGVSFHNIHYGAVDSKASSEVLSLISSSAMASPEVLDFAEPITDSCYSSKFYWSLFRDLLLEEDGYIRFDHDPDNENGKLHPLNHLDVFYSQSSTFKIGVGSRLSMQELSDILDIKSECHFLSKA